MAASHPSIVAHYERNLAASFGVVVLVLVMLVLGAALYLFQRTQRADEDRLCGALAAIVSESISRVSFSGKYHARELVQELLTRSPELAYISMETAEGKVLAHSVPARNDTQLSQDAHQQVLQSLAQGGQVLSELDWEGRAVREVVVPYRGGYGNQLAGIVRVGVLMDIVRAEQWTNLAMILVLVLGLTLLAFMVVMRLSRFFGAATNTLASQLSGILENAPTAIAVCDSAGLVLSASHTLYALPGVRLKPTVGGHRLEALLPEEAKGMLAPQGDDPALPMDKEWTFHHAGQEHVWHCTRFPIARDGAGNVQQHCVVISDVTLSRAAEGKMRALLQRLRTITATVPVVLYEISADDPENTLANRFSYVNEKISELLGVSAEDIMADPVVFASRIHADDRDAVIAASQQAMQEHGDFFQEFRAYHTDGHELWLRASSMPSGYGTWIGYLMDITATKANEIALAQSEIKYRAIFNNTPVGIFRSNVQGEVLDINPTLARMHGFASREAFLASTRGISSDLYTRPEDRKQWVAALIAKPSGVRMEVELKRSDGETFQAILNASMQVDEDGTPLYIDGTVEDISARKLMEQRLADQLTFQQALMETIPYPVFYKDAETYFVGCNTAYEETFGIRRDNFIGKRVLDLEYLPAEDRITYQAEDEATIANTGRVRKEKSIPFADGQMHQTLYSVSGFRQTDGSPGGLIGVIVDISDLKRAEWALRDSEARYRSVIENIQDMFYRTDAQGRLVLISPSTWKQLGYSAAEDLLGRKTSEFWVEPQARQAMLDRIHQDGSVQDYEVLLRMASGDTLLVSTTSSYYYDANGNVLGVEGVFRDITARKRGEEALRASDARFRAFMDYLPGYVAIKDASSRAVFFNQRFAEMFPDESGQGMAPEQLYPAPIAARIRETDRQALEDGFVIYTEEGRNRQGDARLLETRKFRIPQDNDEDLIGVIITDITEQRYHAEKYRVLFHEAIDSIMLMKDQRIVECNPRTLDIFGCPPERMIGHSPAEFFPPVQPCGQDSMQLAEEMMVQARNGSSHTFEWQHLRCDGTPFIAEMTLTVMNLLSEEYVVGFLRDITERKQMQELMVQTEKMMSVGGLAAGMAHELNNPLGIILQSAQNMERRFSTELSGNRAAAQELGLNLETVAAYMHARGIDEYILGIREAGNRAARIIRTMLDFSRNSHSERTLCPVNDMLDTALRLAANDYDLKKKYDFKSISIIRHYGVDAGAVVCSETEIVQVLLNIIKNAAQAMPARRPDAAPPKLRLCTSRLDKAVRIDIEDNGPGMDAATSKRLFEPFFTTKPVGEGTGLGLSVAYFIITQKHQGRIAVESQPERGTTFTIELPLE